MDQEAPDAGRDDREGDDLTTKLDRALDALYRGRCNLIQACKLAECDQQTMKRFLLDKVQCTEQHPLQLTLDLWSLDQ